VTPLRILLADDNDEVLSAVREELGEEFEIIGTVTNGIFLGLSLLEPPASSQSDDS
jgi:CheY-like chemotaxis protein